MTKYRPAGIVLTTNAMISLKCKLQLKFRNNKNYSSITVNLYTGSHKKYINLYLRIRTYKNCHES
jgi:hypothetical protein